MKDLVVLVADRNAEYAVKGLLERWESLGIREGITWEVFAHPRRDPGCLHEAHTFLQPLAREYRHALVLFDHERCGREQEQPRELADALRQRLTENGWRGRAEVVLLVPELEVWVRCSSPHVAACLGWGSQQAALRRWLADRGYWPDAAAKPVRPKEAMREALRRAHKPVSSAIYLDLARRVSLTGHKEPAFLCFRQALRTWFGKPLA